MTAAKDKSPSRKGSKTHVEKKQPGKPGRPPGPAKAAAPIPELVNTKQMAEFLGISQVWLNKLVMDGVISKASRYEYDLKAATHQFIAFREEHVKKRLGDKGSTSDRMREAKVAEIARRMAREDREIITMDEAMQVVDEVTGIFISTLSSLPARVTSVVRERQRIEAICDEERQRMADRFSEKRAALRSGQQASDAEAEDDT